LQKYIKIIFFQIFTRNTDNRFHNTQMMKEADIRFRLRAYYPNFFTIRTILNHPKSQGSWVNQPGALKPELEYANPGEEIFRPLPVTNLDVLILLQPDREQARQYLRQLIKLHQDHQKTSPEKEQIIRPMLDDLRKLFGNVSFMENDYVVPSIADKQYNEQLLSQKGKVLHDLYREGYPVPDFCILTSQSYNLDPSDRKACLKVAIANLESMTGEKLGDPDRALIFAMRTATPYYIPGLMPTYLNAGVTKDSYRSLELRYGRAVANKIYLNNLQWLCQILGNQPGFCHPPEAKLSDEKEETEKQINRLFEKIRTIDERLLYDAAYQVEVFMENSDNFYSRNQDLIYTFQRKHLAFPSLILQKMVWTVRNRESYPGVLYSRHPRTGLGNQIESVREIFGEEIMTGTIRAEEREYFNRNEIKEEFPAVYHFTPMLPTLEVKLKSPATIEFAVESFETVSLFAILQLNMSELTGRSTLLAAINLYQKNVINKERVIQLIRPYHLRQIFSERIDDTSLKSLTLFGSGLSVLPRSAVSARIFFTMAKALEAKKRGEKVCLCKDNFIPSETIFMAELDAIMSMNPLAIHVVTACLGYGIPAFINLKNYQMRLEGNAIINDAGVTINEGDWVTVSSKRHCIFLGKATYRPARFQKYLEGISFEMEPKEKKVFINMSRAYAVYQKILNTIRTEEAMTLPDLVKLIRNDYERQPAKAVEFVNGWFDAHQGYYYSEILKSGLGSHQDQHKIYSLLTTNRKILFFDNMIRKCTREQLSGFSAGAFMLGRFLCQPHPVSFWKAFDAPGIVFLLNEHILFDKYMQVLYEFGERHLSRTKNKILTDDLNGITLSRMDTDLFLSLKLSAPDWMKIEESIRPEHDKQTDSLVAMLKKPFGDLILYDQPWSFEKLQAICQAEKLDIPAPEAV